MSQKTPAELKRIADEIQAAADSLGARRVAHNRTRENRVFSVAEALARGDEQGAANIRAEIAREDALLDDYMRAERLKIQEATRAHATYAEAALPEAISAASALTERLEQLLSQVFQVAQEAGAAKRHVEQLHRGRCRPLSPFDEPPEPVIPLSGRGQQVFALATGLNWVVRKPEPVAQPE